ncbi:MAG: protein-glutamate O-methyltransferase CheR [Deltaproteobacteria bacterium]|nr:protein-glutamate O-methyltransferase CheR [Deltaproteobacteria bacterium]
MNQIETENLEVELLVEAIVRRYGYDFRHYSRASLKRRMNHFLSKTEYGKLSEMIHKVLYDRSFFDALLYGISVPVTEMFRDPGVYRAIREKVVGTLKTYPFIKVWHAGCATGEEAYSLAILLKEEGLYDRTRIYATDFNDEALDTAKKGIYPVDRIKEYTDNYQKSGGRDSFSRYYHSRYGSAIMNQDLKKNIVFANHNLASDAVFGETHFVMCRNVLIYFDRPLQNRALKLFHDSLVYKGFLCLGTKESLRFSDFQERFSVVDRNGKIYRKLETRCVNGEE